MDFLGTATRWIFCRRRRVIADASDVRSSIVVWSRYKRLWQRMEWSNDGQKGERMIIKCSLIDLICE
ncbi:hypothetical protein GCK32_012723 [Trichostrongylus colubriformis]|uniref:Uncharacterized protein n=1 Tax=Trichostrongylus colubriformis TaxID=6319 RepID=A0AAN8FMI9_TRICO